MIRGSGITSSSSLYNYQAYSWEIEKSMSLEYEPSSEAWIRAYEASRCLYFCCWGEFKLRLLVYLVIYDSGKVSLEYLLLSWHPSHVSCFSPHRGLQKLSARNGPHKAVNLCNTLCGVAKVFRPEMGRIFDALQPSHRRLRKSINPLQPPVWAAKVCRPEMGRKFFTSSVGTTLCTYSIANRRV